MSGRRWVAPYAVLIVAMCVLSLGVWDCTPEGDLPFLFSATWSSHWTPAGWRNYSDIDIYVRASKLVVLTAAPIAAAALLLMARFLTGPVSSQEPMTSLGWTGHTLLGYAFAMVAAMHGAIVHVNTSDVSDPPLPFIMLFGLTVIAWALTPFAECITILFLTLSFQVRRMRTDAEFWNQSVNNIRQLFWSLGVIMVLTSMLLGFQLRVS